MQRVYDVLAMVGTTPHAVQGVKPHKVAEVLGAFTAQGAVSVLVVPRPVPDEAPAETRVDVPSRGPANAGAAEGLRVEELDAMRARYGDETLVSVLDALASGKAPMPRTAAEVDALFADVEARLQAAREAGAQKAAAEDAAGLFSEAQLRAIWDAAEQDVARARAERHQRVPCGRGALHLARLTH